MNPDVHALAGAYALDALPADEAGEFTKHLRQCDACQQEAGELQVTAAQLGLAVTAPPPPQLRVRVLHAVERTRQVPPVLDPTDIAGARHRRRSRRLAAAAAVVLVLAAGLLAGRSTLDDAAQPSASGPVAAVMDAPDARSSTKTLRGGGSMTLVSSRALDEAVILGEHLPRLDQAHDYQLWMVDPAGRARSADVLIDGLGERSTGPNLIHGLRPGDKIAITEEPAGGSVQPTSTPLAITRRT
jgi:anti-sigma-K factor RskA